MYDARIVFLGVYMVLKQKCLVQSKSDYLRWDLYKITKEEIDLLYEATKFSVSKTTYGFYSAMVPLSPLEYIKDPSAPADDARASLKLSISPQAGAQAGDLDTAAPAALAAGNPGSEQPNTYNLRSSSTVCSTSPSSSDSYNSCTPSCSSYLHHYTGCRCLEAECER